MPDIPSRPPEDRGPKIKVDMRLPPGLARRAQEYVDAEGIKSIAVLVEHLLRDFLDKQRATPGSGSK